MKDSPLVSVVIPVYNVALYLEQCLETVLSQSLSDIEVICIDDKSTDGSLLILRKYLLKDRRMHLIVNDINRGAAYCRNIGMNEATGKYIAILDSDDYFSADMLEKSYTVAEMQNADIICWENYIYDNTNRIVTRFPRKSAYLRHKISKPFRASDIPDMIFEICHIASWTKLFRRSFLENCGIKFQELPTSNDIYFGMMVLLLASKIACIEEPFVFYRSNRVGQISGVVTFEKHLESTIKACVAVKKKMDEMGLFQKYKRAFYHRVMRLIVSDLRNLSLDGRKKYIDMLSNEGWHDLNMEACCCEDFPSRLDFARWEDLYRYKDYEKMASIGMEDFFDSPKVFDDLKQFGEYIYLWDDGERTEYFRQMAQRHGLKNVILLTPLNLGPVFVSKGEMNSISNQDFKNKVILFFDYALYDEISKQLLQAKITKVDLIDMDTYYRFGVSLQECCYGLNE